ncbi:hypothetical protein V3C99_004383 [Haemonchus contortus]
MIIEPNPTAERIENDMTATLNEIRNQAAVATTVRSEWFHILCSASLREMGPAERVQLLNHFLLTVSLTKERLLRFGTRYVLMDRVYESRTQGDEELANQREQWLQIEDPQVQIKEVMAIVEKDVRRLETTMKEIKEYMAAADRELKSNRQQLEAADILTKSIQTLEDKLRMIPNQSSDDKIKILHERLTALEMTQKPTEPRKGESLAIQVDVNKGRTVVAQETAQVAERKDDPKKSLPAQAKERADRKLLEETDEQYFGRLVLETSETKQKAKDRMLLSSVEKAVERAVERQEPSEDRQNLQRKRTSSDREPIAMVCPTEPSVSHKKGRISVTIHPGVESQSKELCREIDAMESALSKYPYRKIIQWSTGIQSSIECIFCGSMGTHYSDSCPMVVEGCERLQVAMAAGRCLQCLKLHEGACTSKEDGCWYCRQLRQTPFEDIIPLYRHHRALCPVPDAKRELQERVSEKRRELVQKECERASSSRAGMSRTRP